MNFLFGATQSLLEYVGLTGSSVGRTLGRAADGLLELGQEHGLVVAACAAGVFLAWKLLDR